MSISKNKFNKLTSKEWLPFQKSWFRYEGKEKLYKDNIRFFTLDASLGGVYYSGDHEDDFRELVEDQGLEFYTEKESSDHRLQFAVIDLTERLNKHFLLQDYQLLKKNIIAQVKHIYHHLGERRFLAVFIPNLQINELYFPFAWDLAKSISTIFSLKDEKISCADTKDFFYCLYFRKDEHSQNNYFNQELQFFQKNQQDSQLQNKIPGWFILKPQPRKKDEVLHPAKYPEDLAEMFIRQFTKEGDNVFDPMAGTGSTQVAALKLNRNAYGTELSEFFSEIANKRCSAWLRSKPLNTHGKSENNFRIINKDARLVTMGDFPALDYIITSPPYWDMLNMKGAENQAKRIEKGLQTNYSDSDKDLGNINDYNLFLEELRAVYLSLLKLMKPGAYITIIVKNIKKKGRNYPFAWDLANELQKELILLPEVFWCQDDISIAPYGYGNTWVSNTFHHYCLTFQKRQH